MTPVYLIELSDFTPFRNITSNVDLNKLKPYILEAQQLDLKDMLGDPLYYDLLNHPSNSIYVDLLGGMVYIDTYGKTVQFDGIKTALVYFAYARYIQNSGLVNTAYGPVVKTNPDSVPASEKSIARQVNNARSAGLAYMNDVHKFLNVNFEDYPLWISGGCGAFRSPSGSVKISAVGDCSNDYYNDRFSDGINRRDVTPYNFIP